MTGKPELRLGDLYEFPMIRLDGIQDNKSNDKIYIDSEINLHTNRLKSSDGWIKIMSNTKWSNKHTSIDERLEEIGKLIQKSNGAMPIESRIDNYLKHINSILSDMWKNEKITSVEIILMDVVGRYAEARVYNKKKSRVPNWKRTGLPKNVHTRAKKPLKLESKKMYKSPVKKGNTLTKSCKRMTGDVTALGKNFNKLI